MTSNYNYIEIHTNTGFTSISFKLFQPYNSSFCDPLVFFFLALIKLKNRFVNCIKVESSVYGMSNTTLLHRCRIKCGKLSVRSPAATDLVVFPGDGAPRSATSVSVTSPRR